MASNMCQILIPLLLICLPLTKSLDFNFPAVFNFGDSNSDTGGLVSGVGKNLGPPNGQTYFKKPSGRFSDGRLIIDFLMDAMKLPFLNSYLDAIGMPSFKTGCNFAAAASSIHPATAKSISPFSFDVQVAQFFRFKTIVEALRAESREFDKYIPAQDSFQKALYMFDIGQNDITGLFYTLTLEEILALIPTFIFQLETGIQELYEQGVRNFWIHNTGPVGCLPHNIDKFGSNTSRLDELGCVSSHNQAARVFNQKLYDLCFEQPLMVCCGYGGPPLNYDKRISCGETKNLNGSSVTVTGCSDSTKYVSWDGVHHTEAANQYVARQILTGKYSDHSFAC